jgi:hypothetical protein
MDAEDRHGSSVEYRQKAEIKRSNAFVTQGRAKGPSAPKFAPRECDWCHEVYQPKRKKSYTCSTPCRVAKWRAKNTVDRRLSDLEARVKALESGR